MKIGRLLKNVLSVGGFTAFSRVLGFVREMLQSRLIGAGFEQSAFTLAFAIPNMARKLFGEGALTAAFIPVFRSELESGNSEEAKKLARAVLSLVLMILGSIVVLVVLGLSFFLEFRANLSVRADLTFRLVRILFPYMVFICGAAFGMGVLNALGRFIEGAVMPAFLNIIWIGALGLLCFFPNFPTSTRITFVCWAILIGGALQMFFLFHCMRKRGFGFCFVGPRSFCGEKFRLVWKNTLIGALGAGAIQLNYALDQILGQLAAPWAAGVIGYAERLMDLPLGVVGVAFGTVLLPTFSTHFAKDDAVGAKKALRRSIFQVLAVMLPASIITYFCAPLIVKLIYEGRAFDATATLRVSRALSVYGLGMCFFSIQKCLVPFFQAQKDMKTPLRVTVKTVILNALLNIAAVIFLPIEWRHVGLAASTSFCALIGCVLLFNAMHIRRETV